MVIEAWESILRKEGNTGAADKAAGFRERFGDANLPYSEFSHRLALVEVEDRMNQVLPWAPPTTRQFISEIFYRKEENYPPRNYNPRDLPMEYWIKRAQAVMYGFWGTAAGADEVVEGFSLPHASTVRHILNRYINYAPHRIEKTDLLPLFKLKQPAVYSPRKDVEEIREYDDIWIYLQRRYLPAVQEISDQLERKRVVFVDAPFGSGKTFNIQHQVEWQFMEKGYAVESVDGQIYRSSSGILSSWNAIWREASKDQPKLFVIDEAPALVLREGGIVEESIEENEKLMRKIQSEDIRLLLINATRDSKLRQTVVEHFQAIFQKLGVESVVHHVRQTHVPPELARQDLTILGAESDLIDFFLQPENAALLNIRLYDLHRGNRSIAALRDALTMFGLWHIGAQWQIYLRAGQGGSKDDVVRMLTNIGILTGSEYEKEWLEQIPDY